ncbi:MAG TPA: hypothetical protein VMD92_15460 [Acidobacteriaceae bacterium]|jgi:hypothetical protein|nr:hypothetical protein [Acidobacteriaceae bacterium]
MTLLAWIIVAFLAVVLLALIVATPSPEIPRSDQSKSTRRSANRGGS